MGAITIRNLPDPVHDALRDRAAASNLSVEALVRNLLAAATTPASPGDTGAISKMTGMSEAQAAWAAHPAPDLPASDLWGALKGCIHLPAGTDLTQPVETGWEAAQ